MESATLDRPQAAAPVKKGRIPFNLSQIISLELPIREDGITPIVKDDGYKGKVRFYLYVGTEACAHVRMECTRKVYDYVRINPRDTTHDKGSTFVAYLNPDTRVIEDLSAKEKPRLPGFGIDEEAKNTSSDANLVIITRSPDGSAVVSQLPGRVTPNQGEEICQAIKSAERKFHPGDRLLEKYAIMYVMAGVGEEKIYVNPMPQDFSLA